MVRNPAENRIHDRAIWRGILLVAALASAVALLAGCSATDDPVAPAVPSDELGKAAWDAQGALAPEARLAVSEPNIGRWLAQGRSAYFHVYIMAGEPLQFSWRGIGGSPLGAAETYRHGWDVQDPDDPDDPGWAGPVGGGAQDCQSEEMVFWGGLHELTIERRDGDHLLVRVVIGLSAEPVRDQVPEFWTGPTER